VAKRGGETKILVIATIRNLCNQHFLGCERIAGGDVRHRRQTIGQQTREVGERGDRATERKIRLMTTSGKNGNNSA
jgi:hypothetical protein